jgi:hypothetical protein
MRDVLVDSVSIDTGQRPQRERAQLGECFLV